MQPRTGLARHPLPTVPQKMTDAVGNSDSPAGLELIGSLGKDTTRDLSVGIGSDSGCAECIHSGPYVAVRR